MSMPTPAGSLARYTPAPRAAFCGPRQHRRMVMNPPTSALHFRNATVEDVDSISSLMLPDSTSQGGPLYGDFPATKIRSMLDQNLADALPVVLAEDEEGLLAVLFTASGCSPMPLLVTCASLHRGTQPFIFYGPVCIAPRGRGRGLLAALHEQAHQRAPGFKALLFVNTSNAASLKAHAKLGLNIECSFEFEGESFALLSETS